MKKHTEKPPIDDLFARKLGNMSLTPGNDAWKVLQERLGQKKQRVVIWRNPDLYRYAAAAACLILVALVGWKYWPAGTRMQVNDRQVAATSGKPVQPTENQASNKEETNVPSPQNQPANTAGKQLEQPVEQIASVRKPSRSADLPNKIKSRPEPSNVNAGPEKALQSEEPVVAKSEPAKGSMDQLPAVRNEPVVVAAKPTPTAERVLVVTIAEPDALIAARQAAQETEEKVVMMNAEETKKKGVKKLLDQLQRVKQGEVMTAKNDNEQGTLLGWAYRGIKQSFEKDKSDKQ